MPMETTTALCSMVMGGVFHRHPGLKVCFAHGGGSYPFTLGRIQHGYDVRPDLCATDCPLGPRHFAGRFYTDSLVHDALSLRLLVDVVGADRVVLGSDYPFPLGEARPGSLVESVDQFDSNLKVTRPVSTRQDAVAVNLIGSLSFGTSDPFSSVT